METRSPIPATWGPRLLSVVRIVVAFLWILHGTQKLFAVPVSQPRNPVQLFSRAGAAGVIEAFGGSLILLGLFTRPVAFVASGEMASAYFLSHAPRGFWPILNGGEAAAFFCFFYLYLGAVGGGPWSLDRLLQRNRQGPGTAG